MKIAITSLYLPSSSKIGVGYQVHGLANQLVARGHQVTVFSPAGVPAEARYLVHTLPASARFQTFNFAWDLRKIDWSDFDVLNAHGDDWFLWGRRRPRHVHTYHGSCLAEMFHSSDWTSRVRMGALATCEYNSLLLADETVAVSENTRQYIPGIRQVIPCGVDTCTFHPGAKSKKPSVLFVGTLHGRKRGRMLLDLFTHRIKPRVKDAEMWCVCDAPNGEPVADGVKFLGRIDHATLTQLYRQAWVFCLPSSYEGFGVPYIEALASGTAVVASPNPGACEVLDGGRWGCVSPDHQMADDLVAILGDRRRREEVEMKGLHRARKFCWESVCSRYERLYAGETVAAIPRSIA